MNRNFNSLQIGSDDTLKILYQFNGITINKSETIRDLGVLVGEDFSFKPHIAEITDNAANFASWPWFPHFFS